MSPSSSLKGRSNMWTRAVSFVIMTFYRFFLINTFKDTPLPSNEWHLQINQISLLFLFSYPRYHVRYSFVPCKYTPGRYHSSISFFHLSVSVPNCCCHSKLITAQDNSWRCLFFFHVPSYEKRLYWDKRKRKQSIRRTQHPRPHSPEQMHQQHVIMAQTGSLEEIKQKPWTWFRTFSEEPTHFVSCHVITPILSLLPAEARTGVTAINYY